MFNLFYYCHWTTLQQLPFTPSTFLLKTPHTFYKSYHLSSKLSLWSYWRKLNSFLWKNYSLGKKFNSILRWFLMILISTVNVIPFLSECLHTIVDPQSDFQALLLWEHSEYGQLLQELKRGIQATATETS